MEIQEKFLLIILVIARVLRVQVDGEKILISNFSNPDYLCINILHIFDISTKMYSTSDYTQIVIDQIIPNLCSKLKDVQKKIY